MTLTFISYVLCNVTVLHAFFSIGTLSLHLKLPGDLKFVPCDYKC
jgi:hypothetical protein